LFIRGLALPIEVNLEHPFLSGGGEAAQIIADLDWSRTSLGPIQSWPAVLKSTLSLVLRSTVPIVTLWGEDGVMIYNDAYSEFAGGRHPQLFGSKVREGWPEVNDFNDNIMKVGLAGQPLSYQDQELTLNRRGVPEPAWMDLSYSPILDEGGKPCGVMAIVIETTAKKRHELALRESEARFRLVAENAPVMLWMGDETGKCTYLNKAQREFWGVAPDGLATFDWMTTVQVDDEAQLAAFAHGMQTHQAFSVETRMRRIDGALRIITTAAKPRFGPQGEFLGMIGVNVDVTETRDAEAALQSLNATLEQRVLEEVYERSKAEDQLRQIQKMEAVGQLTGGIAHDFNNMLAVVLGGLSLLQRKLEKGETNVGHLVNGAIDGARRASALTQRLLAFSRQQSLNPETLDLNQMVSGMIDLLARTIGEQISVQTMLAPDLWKITADAGQLENALLNLSVNARDAMPNGGELNIETSNVIVTETVGREYAIEPGQYVLIVVSDSGVGMTDDVLAKVFEPFYTTKGVGKGTGLGLSQVYGFVRQSGGHVKISSTLDVGTSVKLYLPRFHGDEVEERQEKDISVVYQGRPNETVLVVEDEDRVRKVSVEALQELGYSVIEVARPRDALQFLSTGQNVSLLFTDVVMPDMSGKELADVARKERPDLRVLYTTGYTRDAIVHNGTLDPGIHLLTKPFSIDELAIKVREVLNE